MPTALPDERTAADYVSLASRLVQQHLMEKPLPKGVSDLAPAQRASYLAFRDHQTEARSLMTVCSSMSALTTPAPDAREQRARTCFQRGQDLGGSLARDVDQLEEARRTGNSPSEGSEEPSARSISESDVAQFRSYATRFQAGVQCVSQGTALEECAGARAPTAPASTTSPTSASPAACGPANPLR
jgi:hypothetical protein